MIGAIDRRLALVLKSKMAPACGVRSHQDFCQDTEFGWARHAKGARDPVNGSLTEAPCLALVPKSKMAPGSVSGAIEDVTVSTEPVKLGTDRMPALG